MFKDNLFKKVEDKTNVKKEDIIKLAESMQNKDLSQDDNLRQLIKDVAKLAGKEVSGDREKKIMDLVKGNKIPKDIDKLL